MADMIMIVDTALASVPVNLMPLIDDTTFKDIETAVVYNSAGMALTWNFVTASGVASSIAVTPTTGGSYDWTEPVADKGMYAIEMPASGGASANNDTEGFGWFTGVATGILPWRGPVIQFSPANVVNSLVNGSASLKVDLETIKTQTVTCSGGVTVPAATLASTTNITAGTITTVGTLTTYTGNTPQTGDGYAIVNSGTHGNAALKTLIDTVDTVVDTILVDTNELQTDWVNGGRLDLLIDAILADTNELQTDWVNGGRLDLILDARASQTSVDTIDSNVDAVLVDTGEIGAAGAGLTALATASALTAVAADLPQKITKNVALAAFPFTMVDATDGYTLETGLTITAERSIDGGAFASCANSASEVNNGSYKIDLAAADLNGNTIMLRLSASGARTRHFQIVTQPT